MTESLLPLDEDDPADPFLDNIEMDRTGDGRIGVGGGGLIREEKDGEGDGIPSWVW